VPNPKRTVTQTRSSFAAVSLLNIRYTSEILIPPRKNDRSTCLKETPKTAINGIRRTAGNGG
jgi:hypothetical protein